MYSDIATTAGIFRALGDTTRLRLVALCARGDQSVGDLVNVTGLSQPRVSQQLKVLIDAALLERYRDGQFVYYRLGSGEHAPFLREICASLSASSVQVEADRQQLSAAAKANTSELATAERALNRAVLDCFVGTAVGRVLDIGSGAARMLSLLSDQATEAVGVDVDRSARRIARRRLGAAGLANCTIQNADVRALPFTDGYFDTVIVDDVLRATENPIDALAEAARVLSDGGQMLILERSNTEVRARTRHVGRLAADVGVRLAAPRRIPTDRHDWWLMLGKPATAARRAAS